MISLHTLRTKKSQLLTLVSICLVGAALFSACTVPMATKPGSTAAKPATSTQGAAKPVPTTSAIVKPSATQVAGKPAANQPAAGMETVMLHKDAKLGSFLTDGKGMTLYVYDKDSAGKSDCTGNCTKDWQPYTVADANAKLTEAPGLPGKLSIIKRDDGKFQVAYDGMPLYHFYEDKQMGDLHGQGMDNNWWVFSPDGKEITTKVS
ncbi:MAG: hypothetical protein DYG89_03740 [Caldilinea sp. CFX5]|nr:hypothetical protein [Caldilinea sp. CFX5]